ncbi:hypothetical protein KAR91_37510 [Candidatus Pacearchaeota archaeon]|nr:hypothetical protein [Candidatus Pacearchaeota archaeon]
MSNEEGNETCVMCGRQLEDEEDATGISSGVAKENDGFNASDTPWEVIGSCCAPKLEGFLEHHEGVTKFIEDACNDLSMGETARQIAYELKIPLGK